MCVLACVFVFVFVLIYVCVCVCMCEYVFVCVCVCVRAFVSLRGCPCILLLRYKERDAIDCYCLGFELSLKVEKIRIDRWEAYESHLQIWHCSFLF